MLKLCFSCLVPLLLFYFTFLWTVTVTHIFMSPKHVDLFFKLPPSVKYTMRCSVSEAASVYEQFKVSIQG